MQAAKTAQLGISRQVMTDCAQLLCVVQHVLPLLTGAAVTVQIL